MPKIVYIAGLAHSGSTVLDMALGCHPKMVGLGEVEAIVQAGENDLTSPEFNKVVCSCGKDMGGCDFWSGAKERLLTVSHMDTDQRYTVLIKFFSEKYGEDVILVDSSNKRMQYLNFLNEKHDLYVIFLVRDLRSWVYSRHIRVNLSLVKLAYQWLDRNLRTKRFLNRNKFNYMTVGYEEVALYPEMLLEKICEFVGLPFDEQMLEPFRTSSHVIRGNRARGDREVMRRFFYDARWLTSVKLSALGTLLFPLMLWNRKHVYGNILKGKTRAFGVSQPDFAVFSVKKNEELVFELQEVDRVAGRDKGFKKQIEKSL
jgi:hypothetical protein